MFLLDKGTRGSNFYWGLRLRFLRGTFPTESCFSSAALRGTASAMEDLLSVDATFIFGGVPNTKTRRIHREISNVYNLIPHLPPRSFTCSPLLKVFVFFKTLLYLRSCPLSSLLPKALPLFEWEKVQRHHN